MLPSFFSAFFLWNSNPATSRPKKASKNSLTNIRPSSPWIMLSRVWLGVHVSLGYFINFGHFKLNRQGMLCAFWSTMDYSSYHYCDSQASLFSKFFRRRITSCHVTKRAFSIYQDIPEIPVGLQMEHDFSVPSTGKFPEKVELLGRFRFGQKIPQIPVRG